jgi:hypothetical protein
MTILNGNIPLASVVAHYFKCLIFAQIENKGLTLKAMEYQASSHDQRFDW